jgi:hypothetical protein
VGVLTVASDAAFVVAGVWGILCAVFEFPTYAGVGASGPCCLDWEFSNGWLQASRRS